MPNDTTLTNWAIHHGCTFHYLKISIHDEYGGFGLFNSISTTSTYDEILRTALFVPNSLIISIELISEVAEESEELADVLNLLPPLQNLEPIIAVFLLYQVHLQRHNIPSKWSTYIDHLPKSSLLPITWNESEVNFLEQSSISISHAVPAKLAFLKSIYATLTESPGWFQSITWHDYLLAQSWVSSRTIECPRTNSPLLVPILDMANHSTSRNAAWEVTDDGIELRREPVDIAAGEEITISYDLDRGTGERLYRYGFIEDTDLNVPTKAITILDPSPPKVPGGNVYRLSLTCVRGGFSDLSFLTYENWLNILPLYTSANPVVLGLCLPTENEQETRIVVTPAEEDVKYFQTPDLPSLLEALNYKNTFPHARECALGVIKNLVEYYEGEIWKPDENDNFEEILKMEEYCDIRREVWHLIRICCAQERNLLRELRKVLNSGI